jgi:hypothetical protein
MIGRLQLLLAASALLTTLIVQPGELGSSDTNTRLQTSHSFWRNTPQARKNDPNFGLVGRGGRIYSKFGMGQSLLMLPFDILASGLKKLAPSLVAGDPVRSTTWNRLFVAYSVSALLCILGVLASFRMLRLFEFTSREAAAGSLALLFATTFLHYTQNMQENNYVLLLTLAGLGYQYEWAKTGSKRALLYGCLACGTNLLTRLTTVLDWLAVILFLLLFFWFTGLRQSKLLVLGWDYVKTAVPIFLLFFAIDRAYNFYRFESWFNTYISVFGAQYRMQHPEAPSSFPFSGSLLQGLAGPFFAPEKSIFLFDPLFLVTIAVVVGLCRRIGPVIRAFLSSLLVLLLTYVFLYARYFEWSGDFAWGDRFVSTPVQLAAFISVPLLLRHRRAMRPFAWGSAVAVLVVSVAIQVASTVFWYPLEILQQDPYSVRWNTKVGISTGRMQTIHPTFVVGLRVRNIAASVLGKSEAWGLMNERTRADGLISVTPWYFPVLAHRTGLLSPALSRILLAIWGAMILLLGAVLLRIARACSLNDSAAPWAPQPGAIGSR